MKTHLMLLSAVLLIPMSLLADLPVITSSPTNKQVAVGASATFNVTVTGATGYRWRFNGQDITGATNSSCTVTNAQYTNAGYYVVIAKNASGWAPSQMAYLSVGSGGVVPFDNYTIPQNMFTRVCYPLFNGWFESPGQPSTTGEVFVWAGPELDQMQMVDSAYWNFMWGGSSTAGYYSGGDVPLINVAPGQTVYYQVHVIYPENSYEQLSTVLKLTAGGGAYPVPSDADIKFPLWEMPDPYTMDNYYPYPPTNFVRVAGETVSFTNFSVGYTDFGLPTNQWRKDGFVITNGVTNTVWVVGPIGGGSAAIQSVLVISNLQASDAGIYDAYMLGNLWYTRPKIKLSVLLDGQGVLVSPRTADDTNFVCDLQGAQGRQYVIQRSTNLTDWADLLTLSNSTGMATFTNELVAPYAVFYRSRLLP